ncbi:MAG: hypothetical protein AAGA75_18220 [Cyanobacteria bacterium P01_E01_bin.6]
MIATWQVGGTVVEFQWRIFWGYIIPSGYFTAVEYWWIALSGNVVSIALGLIALPAVVAIKKQVIKELLYSFAVVQLVYSLVLDLLQYSFHHVLWTYSRALASQRQLIVVDCGNQVSS